MKNAAPLYPNRKNSWVVLVSQAIAKNNEDVRRYVKGMLGRLESGSVSEVKFGRLATSRLNPVGGSIIRRENMDPIPMLVAGHGVVWCEVSFAWRSPTTEVPWPAERFAALPVNDWTRAEILLDAVGVPGDAVSSDHPSAAAQALDSFAEEVTATPARSMVAVGVVVAAVMVVLAKVRK